VPFGWLAFGSDEAPASGRGSTNALEARSTLEGRRAEPPGATDVSRAAYIYRPRAVCRPARHRYDPPNSENPGPERNGNAWEQNAAEMGFLDQGAPARAMRFGGAIHRRRQRCRGAPLGRSASNCRHRQPARAPRGHVPEVSVPCCGGGWMRTTRPVPAPSEPQGSALLRRAACRAPFRGTRY
jgi:hypothetical protein